MDDDFDLKTYRKLLKMHRQEYIEDNDCELVKTDSFPKDCCGRAIHKFQPDTHEAWIMQCPKGMSLDPLVGKRIKVPGRRYISGMQVRGVKYAEPQPNAVGYVNPKGKYTMRMLPISGYVVASKRLNMHKPNEVTPDVFPVLAKPRKPKVPLRHPFFGRDYKSHVELPEKIAENVRQAVEKNYATTRKLRRTANFYKIRTRLLATSQTLMEKEQEVRQSVLTGIVPQFMREDEHPDYLGLYGDRTTPPIKEEIADSAEEKRPKKQRKHHRAEVALADSNANVEVKLEPVSPAKESTKKQRKSMHAAPELEEDTESVVGSKKSKRKRKHRHTDDEQETQMNGIVPHIKLEESDHDDVIAVKQELASEDEIITTKKKKKSKKHRHKSETEETVVGDKSFAVPDIKLEQPEDDDVVIVAVTPAQSNGEAKKHRKKHKHDK